jgi:hypothetical protein
MPSVAQPVQAVAAPPVEVDQDMARSRLEKPLRFSGALDLPYNDVTPVIGREFPRIQLVDILRASNADDVIRDLAVTSKFPNPGKK